MANFFGLFGERKESKGVDENMPQKRRFFIFFDVYFRKFFKFIQLNLLFVIFSLPYMLLLYFFSPINIELFKSMGIDPSAIPGVMINQTEVDIVMRAMFAFSVIIFWGSGPASAGAGIVMRKFAHESHSWIWGDFWEYYKKNFKTAMVVVILDAVVIVVSASALTFYGGMIASDTDGMMRFMQVVVIIALVIYTFMHYYIYQIMIGYKVKLKQLYNNAFLFAVAKLPQNLMLTILSFVIFIFFYVSVYTYAMVLSAVLLVALCSFIIMFYTSHVVQTVAVDTKK